MPTENQRASLSTEDSIYALLTRRVALWLRRAPCPKDDLHAARTIDVELGRLGSVVDLSPYSGLRERLLRTAYPPAKATSVGDSAVSIAGAQAHLHLSHAAMAERSLARTAALG